MLRQLRSFSYCLMTLAVALSAPALAQDTGVDLLRWDSNIYPGLARHDLEGLHAAVGLSTHREPAGFTYTSKLSTAKRDYLFCNDKLFAIIEGEQVDSHEFVMWMSAYVAAREKLGDPASITIDTFFGQLTTVWKVGNGDELYFQLRTAEPDVIIWSQQLSHLPISNKCSDK